MTGRLAKIQAVYAAEEGRRDAPVYRAADLPLSYEAITAEWLTDALCKDHPGAVVSSFTLGPVDSGSSNRRKISLNYNEAGIDAGLPDRLFCKATHDLANRIVLGISLGAQGECSFYNHIRPHLDIEAPEAVFAGYDPATVNSLIMMHDLSDSVTSFCDHKTEMTRVRAESQMALLATCHGRGYGDPLTRESLTSIGTWPEFFNRTLEFGMEAGSNAGFLAAEEVIPARTFARYDEIWPRMVDSVERHNHLPLTMMHGDVHLKNWYIAGNGEMGLSDWQCCARGHFSRDVCYAITSALTVEDRRNWEGELVDYYLDRLHAAGGPKLDRAAMWRDYRQQLMTVLTWWTITLRPAPDLPDMQPLDITMEMMRRISTAVDDLDSLDAFG